MPGSASRAQGVPGVMWAFALLFFLKAAALALFVTPLWDVPDEVGHFAYIADIADGRGLPRVGQSTIPPALVAAWKRGGGDAPTPNWIAIHPPGYHLAAVPFLWAARVMTGNLAWQVRLTRLSSALFGAAALPVFFLILRQAGADPLAAMAAAAAVGFVPMYSHMSAGVSNDVLSALLGGLAALFWTRLLRAHDPADATRLGIALAAGAAVKLTAVPLALAWLLLLPFHLPGAASRRALRSLATAAIAFSLPALWVLRQWRLGGRGGVHPLSGETLDPTALLAFLRSNPVADHTFKNFFGLIGWTGTGGGTVRWFQVSGPFLTIYLVLLLALALDAILWCAHQERLWPAGLWAKASWVLFAIVFLLAFETSRTGTGGAGAAAKALVYGSLVAVPFLSVTRVWRTNTSSGGALVFSAQFAILVFLAFYTGILWEAFQSAGQMRATHGRYFFGVIGALLLAFVLPTAELWPARPLRNRLCLLILAALAANELLFFFLKVLPFYAHV
ncbi:MAG TPA: hypothetical protein VMR54_07260 [Thermoanaerobaculia bacterium]|nr:hypothetical protein [Thermoanaerobaculia bacterium]